MNKPEFAGRGLIHRFLFAFPESRQGSRKQQSLLIPKELREEYNNLIDYLLKEQLKNLVLWFLNHRQRKS